MTESKNSWWYFLCGHHEHFHRTIAVFELKCGTCCGGYLYKSLSFEKTTLHIRNFVDGLNLNVAVSMETRQRLKCGLDT